MTPTEKMNEAGKQTAMNLSLAYAFVRKIHNFAVDMNWLPATVIPRRQWPAIHYKEKHAITLEEHQKIISAEVNPERKAL